MSSGFNRNSPSCAQLYRAGSEAACRGGNPVVKGEDLGQGDKILWIHCLQTITITPTQLRIFPVCFEKTSQENCLIRRWMNDVSV